MWRRLIKTQFPEIFWNWLIRNLTRLSSGVLSPITQKGWTYLFKLKLRAREKNVQRYRSQPFVLNQRQFHPAFVITSLMCYRMILHFKWSSLNFKINMQCPGSHYGTSICIDDLFLFIPSSAYSFLPTLFKIILFWDYNVIKSFPFPFLSPHPPIHLSLLSVKFVASLWIIVYILLVCLFSGITICDWRTNWHALPWGRLFLVLFV